MTTKVGITTSSGTTTKSVQSSGNETLVTAVVVGSSSTSVGVTSGEKQSVQVAGNRTHVAKVVVGTPIPVKRISTSSNLNGLNDVDTTNLTNGSVLVYKTATSKWTSTLNLEEQNVNGGSF